VALSTICDSLFEEKPNTRLYHYTSLAGLTGIIDSSSIWATEIRYLNDSAEMNHIVRLLNGLCQQRIAESNNVEHDKILIQFQKWIDNRINDGHMLFVSSFTTEGNLLSQWRGYSPTNKGVSVGFSPEYIISLAAEQSFLIGKCIYDNDTQKDIANEILNSLIAIAVSNGENTNASKKHPSQSYHDTFEQIETDLLRIATLFKHGSFREEQEWRVISNIIVNYTQFPIHYREGISMLVPYINFSLTPNNHEEISISHIYLGPTPNINNSMGSLSRYISASKNIRRGVSITNSQIPFRQW